MSLGYVTLAAKHPEEAIDICKAHSGAIHLLLTDVVLPQMDGRTLFHNLCPARPELRALYMSGYTDDAIVRHGVLESGVHFLQKPFSVNSLAKKVSEVLRGPDRGPLCDRFSAAPEAHGMQDELVAKRIADLPTALIEQLSRAAQEANRRKAVEIIHRVRSRDDELATALQSLLKRYRFDKIISFTEGLVRPK